MQPLDVVRSASGVAPLTHPRPAGFRLSIVDGVLSALDAVATAASIGPLGPMAGVFPMAVGRFLVSCVRRRYELAWTAVFPTRSG